MEVKLKKDHEHNQTLIRFSMVGDSQVAELGECMNLILPAECC